MGPSLDIRKYMIVDSLSTQVKLATAYPSQKFLFRCDECEMIVSVELGSVEERVQVNENKMVLDCPCGGRIRVLRN